MSGSGNAGNSFAAKAVSEATYKAVVNIAYLPSTLDTFVKLKMRAFNSSTTLWNIKNDSALALLIFAVVTSLVFSSSRARQVP